MQFPDLKKRLKAALKEDDAFNDITTQLLPGYENRRVKAHLIARAPGVFCGAFLLKPLFHLLDSKIQVKIHKRDGDVVKKNLMLATIEGKAAALLAGERLYLNLSCHLSGVSTLTQTYVEAIKGTSAVILDTRKTTPLWRDLEKFAVTVGGGQNHRMSLGDAVLVKDNHTQYLRTQKIEASWVYGKARIKDTARHVKFVEMEAKTLDEVWQGIKARADIIMLDNMSLPSVIESLMIIRAARKALGTTTPLIEVSGGITVPKARELAALGVDRISVGALTHSAPSLDLSLEVQ